MLEADGRLRGTAPAVAAPEVHAFTVAVRDAEGFTAERELRLRIAEPRPVAQTRSPGAAESVVLPAYAIADFDADGIDDLLRAATLTSSGATAVELLFGRGDGTLDTPRPVTVPAGLQLVAPSPERRMVAAGRFDADAYADAVMPVLAARSLQLLVLRSDGQRPPHRVAELLPLTGAPNDLVVGEFDGLPGEEIAVGELFDTDRNGAADRAQVTVWTFDTRTGRWTAAVGPASQPAAPPAGLGRLSAPDLDGDGRQELHFDGRIFVHQDGGFLETTLALSGPDNQVSAALTGTLGVSSGRLRDEIVRQQLAPDGSLVLEVIGFSGTLRTGVFDPRDGRLVPDMPLALLASLPVSGGATVRLRAGPLDRDGSEAVVVQAGGRAGAAPRWLYLLAFRDGMFSPPAFDHDHIAQAGLRGRPVGLALLDLGRQSSHAVIDLSDGPDADGPELLLLAHEQFRFDGPEVRALRDDRPELEGSTLPVRILELLAPGRREIVLPQRQGDMLLIELDEAGRPGAEQVLVPASLAGGLPLDVTRIAEGAEVAAAVELLQCGRDCTVSLARYTPLGTGSLPVETARTAPVPNSVGLRSHDFDGDGVDELVLNDLAAATVNVVAPRFAAGGQPVVLGASFVGPVLPDFELLDLDRDGLTDVVCRTSPPVGLGGRGTTTVVIARGLGGGLLAAGVLARTSATALAGAMGPLFGDFDGDDAVDAVTLGRFDDGLVGVDLAANRDGTFASPLRVLVLSERVDALAAGVADADLDGDLDLWVIEQSERELLLLANEGSGSFRLQRRIDLGLRISEEPAPRIALGDLDGDAIDDLVIAVHPEVIVLFGDGRGGWRRAEPEPAPAAR
ncbi:MAG: hypothetical protein KatS3mg102_1217 [Planctomycetota bacterium]|nr:MAG: hypothetical protein KatS3mg102_1217 [Planctomycetota bacterium]